MGHHLNRREPFNVPDDSKDVALFFLVQVSYTSNQVSFIYTSEYIVRVMCTYCHLITAKVFIYKIALIKLIRKYIHLMRYVIHIQTSTYQS